MKILLSNAVVAHGAFHHWMTQDMRALGHEVALIDPDELCEQFGIELYRRVLLQRIAAERPDVLLLYPPYDLLRPEDAQRIHDMGTVTAGFAYDDPIFLPSYLRKSGDFERICAEFERVYDVYVTTSRAIEREAKNRGISHLRHIRWACNTPGDLGDRPRDLPVVVIGAPYPRRVKMVKHLKDRGIRPLVFGAEGWKMFQDVADCYQGMLTRPGMFEMYRRAQIAIAPADWESTYTPMVKLRTLEIMGQGAFQLCETCEDLADYYVDGEEIVSYKDWDDLAELIKRYGAEARRREEIGRAGYEATKRNHVWTVRWSEIEQLARPVIAQYAENKSRAGERDDHLPHELGLSACAAHYEKLGDTATAQIAIDEWLAFNPNYYTSQLAKGRLCLAEKKFDEAERHLKSALGAAANLCPRGVDSTVTQRKLGPRLGLGKVFPGIFPREVEAYCHLLILYAVTDREEDAERLMSYLAGTSQDVLFISIVSMIAEQNIDQVIGPKYLARYVEVVISTDPVVWAGERTRHLAHFWMLRGQSLVALGQVADGRECLEFALTQNPYPNVEQQIRGALAQLGVR
ncbi:MAG TPA: glycosyltransferase [Tepidisphaeraceae bacterium]|jgi:tetratricopeptide (TPR) repeat protein